MIYLVYLTPICRLAFPSLLFYPGIGFSSRTCLFSLIFFSWGKSCSDTLIRCLAGRCRHQNFVSFSYAFKRFRSLWDYTISHYAIFWAKLKAKNKLQKCIHTIRMESKFHTFMQGDRRTGSCQVNRVGYHTILTCVGMWV